MKRATTLIVLALLTLPAGATSSTKGEIREARQAQAACIIAAFFGRPCRVLP